MPDRGLTQAHLAILQDILAEVGHGVEGVSLFGSRATGRARPNSDIDLVLYGPVPEATVDRLRQRFEDSMLPVTVDLLVYDRIADAALKAHIDRVGRRLLAHASPGPGGDNSDPPPIVF
jgi:predicted nucleotidyltransferase